MDETEITPWINFTPWKMKHGTWNVEQKKKNDEYKKSNRKQQCKHHFHLRKKHTNKQIHIIIPISVVNLVGMEKSEVQTLSCV